MKKGIPVKMVLLLCLLLTWGCATTEMVTLSGPVPGITARVLPEVDLQSTQGKITRGKLLRFEDGTLTFLTYPYWGVGPTRVPLEDVAFIRMHDREGNGRGAFLSGFGISFVILGALSALISKYDVEYENGLYGSAISGFSIGITAARIAAGGDSARKKNFNFLEMTVPQKIGALRSIMGAR